MANEKKKTILLIDDDPSILLVVGDRLEFEGYEVLKADNAEAGLAILRRTPPDLIILDIMMRGMSGLGFLKEITTADGKTPAPVLVFTARAAMQEFFQTIKIASFIPKSSGPEVLLREIDKLLGGPRSAPAGSGNRAQRIGILLGEDDDILAGLVIRHLEEAGYGVRRVKTGPQVVEQFVIQHADLVLLNRVMPGLNGDVAAGMLKDLLGPRMIPVVLYDASGVLDNRQHFPGVAKFVPSAAPLELLRVVQSVAVRPQAGAGPTFK
jgi:DNA-binding response OmpR family regulator